MRAFSILIVDDHSVVRQGLATLLLQAGHVVAGEAENGEMACSAWVDLSPDLMLLDLDMPGIGGLETIQRILARDQHAKIIVFSMHDDTVHATRALQAGAKGYVVKSDPSKTLLEAIGQVMLGARFISHDLAQQLAVERVSGNTNPIDALSPREFEVFSRLANGETLAEIAEQLHLSYKSAANIQTHVRQKLNIITPSQLVHLAIQYGTIQRK